MNVEQLRTEIAATLPSKAKELVLAVPEYQNKDLIKLLVDVNLGLYMSYSEMAQSTDPEERQESYSRLNKLAEEIRKLLNLQVLMSRKEGPAPGDSFFFIEKPEA